MSRRSPAAALSRRACLAAIASAAVAGRSVARAAAADDADEERQIAAIRVEAEKLGLGPIGITRSESYLGLGTAPDGFRKAALELCEGLAKDYLKHFTDKKFRVSPPTGRQVVVLLADPESFARFLGIEPGGPVRGTYDLDSNRLVLCDNRGEAGNPMAERANSVTLFHEATHQLTFNTGLLDRQGDVPRCISEGLGMYGETRRPRNLARIGASNPERLEVLATAARQGLAPIASAELLADDAAFNDRERQQRAYAQAWLLVHHLLQTPARLPAFRAYLDAIRPRRSAESRLDDATAAFGDLAALDRELARSASRRPRPASRG